MTDKHTNSRTLRVLAHGMIFLVTLVMMASCGGKSKQQKHDVDPECVYVCSGPKSKRYHSVEDCKGLAKCSGRVIEMTLNEAECCGKTPCRMCVNE